jgi:hypothetical protein
MSPFRNVSVSQAISFTVKLLTVAIAYGILLGQVIQIDQRLGRVESALLSHSLISHTTRSTAPSLVPAAEASPK